MHGSPRSCGRSEPRSVAVNLRTICIGIRSRSRQIWRMSGRSAAYAATMGDRLVDDLGKMPGARFSGRPPEFRREPLRRRDSGPAIIFSGEGRTRDDELSRNCTSRSDGLRHRCGPAGIRSGDRVAGYMPNLPETIVAALGAASVGAVWSSCSPDFGVPGCCRSVSPDRASCPRRRGRLLLRR